MFKVNSGSGSSAFVVEFEQMLARMVSNMYICVEGNQEMVKNYS